MKHETRRNAGIGLLLFVFGTGAFASITVQFENTTLIYDRDSFDLLPPGATYQLVWSPTADGYQTQNIPSSSTYRSGEQPLASGTLAQAGGLFGPDQGVGPVDSGYIWLRIFESDGSNGDYFLEWDKTAVSSGGSYTLDSGAPWNTPVTSIADQGLVVETPVPTATLTVDSAHGTPSPSIGWHEYAEGASVSCSVGSPITDGGTNYSCTGWSGTGDVPASGTSNATGIITLNQDSSITWSWEAFEYWLAVNTTGSGTVSVVDGWVAPGSNVTITAIPDFGWLFAGWSGDLAGDSPSINLTMDGAKTLTATFNINHPPVVSNVQMVQRPGTKLVDVFYDVADADGDTLFVDVNIGSASSFIGSSSFSGDIGSNISTGTNKQITWDAGADWDGNFSALTLAVVAYDDFPCPVAKTGQTTSDTTGDDGDLQPGMAWPDPRFTSITNGTDITVIDHLIGLEWIQDPHALSGNESSTNWNAAIDFCNNLDYANHSDWRLPSRKELAGLVDYGRYGSALPVGHPFIGVQGSYWSGTFYAVSTKYAWDVDMDSGAVSDYYKSGIYHAWPVRDLVLAASSPVPKTGQTNTYAVGDDGDLQSGVAWPDPRFTSITNGTEISVLDHLTGLEWIQAPHALSYNSDPMHWYDAIDFCNNLNYANHSDWRLPSIKELESLVHCGSGSWGNAPYQWLNSGETPFTGVQDFYYWSGTSFAGDTYDAWYMDMGSGSVFHFRKGSSRYNYYVWPVRGGR